MQNSIRSDTTSRFKYHKHQLKARFHYERGKEYSLFILLIFFALASIEAQYRKKRMLFSTLVVETGLNCGVEVPFHCERGKDCSLFY